jgi:hypothetical protein
VSGDQNAFAPFAAKVNAGFAQQPAQIETESRRINSFGSPTFVSASQFGGRGALLAAPKPPPRGPIPLRCARADFQRPARR